MRPILIQEWSHSASISHGDERVLKAIFEENIANIPARSREIEVVFSILDHDWRAFANWISLDTDKEWRMLYHLTKSGNINKDVIGLAELVRNFSDYTVEYDKFHIQSAKKICSRNASDSYDLVERAISKFHKRSLSKIEKKVITYLMNLAGGISLLDEIHHILIAVVLVLKHGLYVQDFIEPRKRIGKVKSIPSWVFGEDSQPVIIASKYMEKKHGISANNLRRLWWLGQVQGGIGTTKVARTNWWGIFLKHNPLWNEWRSVKEGMENEVIEIVT